MLTTARPERRIFARKRRVARAAAAVAIVAAAWALGAGVALAFFSDSTSSLANLALGTVSLGNPQTTTCTYNALTPGDLTGSTHCTFSVTYTGSLPAYMALDVQIQATAGSGGTTLYDGTNTKGLTLSISDGGHSSYTIPTGPGSTGSPCPSGDTCWTASNELAATYGPTSVIFTSGSSVTFTLTPMFPTSVKNPYQGGSATVLLTAHAVQSPGNTIPGTCNTTTIGQSCPAGGGFAWS